MMDPKRKFLLDFYDFHDPALYGMVYFEQTNGVARQGWIYEVNESTIEFKDSGPWASEESFLIDIADVNTKSFAYYDVARKSWILYPSGKVHIPPPVPKKKRSIWHYIDKWDKYSTARQTKVKNWIRQMCLKLI